MGEARPTIPRYFLGEALRQLRSESGHSLDSAAAHIGKNRQRLILLFEGRSMLTVDELEKLVQFLGATGKQRREILALGVQARKAPKDEPYTDLGPDAYRRVAYLEAMASEIRSYDKGVFPALLQSPEYIMAMMNASRGIWWEESDAREGISRVEARMERQRLLFDAAKPKGVRMIFTADAFDALVGDPHVMKTQFAHLRDCLHKHEQLTVRVVPVGALNNPAPSSSFSIFEFGSIMRPIGSLPVVYGPATYTDVSADTDRLRRAFDRIEQLSLTVDDTRAFIESKIEKGD